MSQRVPIVVVAAAVFLLSWFVPVIEGGATLADGVLPGWQAFRLAMAPIWSYEGLSGGDGLWDVISVASGLTNLLFVLGTACVLASGTRRGRRLALALVTATAVNGVWLTMPDAAGTLRVGYWLWLAAFALLATGAVASAGARPSPATATPAASG